MKRLNVKQSKSLQVRLCVVKCITEEGIEHYAVGFYNPIDKDKVSELTFGLTSEAATALYEILKQYNEQ